jgi:hypothetical protein
MKRPLALVLAVAGLLVLPATAALAAATESPVPQEVVLTGESYDLLLAGLVLVVFLLAVLIGAQLWTR